MSEATSVKVTLVAKGEVLLFSHGEYSDYGLYGSFRALSDFDLGPLTAEYRTEVRPDYDRWNREIQSFPAWLCTRGLIEDFPCREFHTGGYSDFEPDWERESPYYLTSHAAEPA